MPISMTVREAKAFDKDKSVRDAVIQTIPNRDDAVRLLIDFKKYSEARELLANEYTLAEREDFCLRNPTHGRDEYLIGTGCVTSVPERMPFRDIDF